MTMIKMSDLNLSNKKVLIRQDLNVPIKNGEVSSDLRIRAALETVTLALTGGAGIILLSHLGRPVEGQLDSTFSLEPVARHMATLLGREVRFERDWIDGVDVQPGEVILCENVRFQIGEKANDDRLSRKMAALCDVFVMDAFGTAHRAQASTHGVAKYAPIACAGALLVTELEALGAAFENPTRPMVAIVGGSKVSTKLTLLKNLINKVDYLIVGGGIANTFLAANDHPTGNSLVEKDLIPEAKALQLIAKEQHTVIPMPEDVVCGTAFSVDSPAAVKSVDDVSSEDMILDLGPGFCMQLDRIMKDAGTIVWNGPLGVFEFDQFASGTQSLADAIAASNAFSIAGGGDTIAAVEKFNIADNLSYISTGGGAFLEFMEGKTLPAVAILEERGSD